MRRHIRHNTTTTHNRPPLQNPTRKKPIQQNRTRPMRPLPSRQPNHTPIRRRPNSHPLQHPIRLPLQPNRPKQLHIRPYNRNPRRSQQRQSSCISNQTHSQRKCQPKRIRPSLRIRLLQLPTSTIKSQLQRRQRRQQLTRIQRHHKHTHNRPRLHQFHQAIPTPHPNTMRTPRSQPWSMQQLLRLSTTRSRRIQHSSTSLHLLSPHRPSPSHPIQRIQPILNRISRHRPNRRRLHIMRHTMHTSSHILLLLLRISRIRPKQSHKRRRTMQQLRPQRPHQRHRRPLPSLHSRPARRHQYHLPTIHNPSPSHTSRNPQARHRTTIQQRRSPSRHKHKPQRPTSNRNPSQAIPMRQLPIQGHKPREELAPT